MIPLRDAWPDPKSRSKIGLGHARGAAGAYDRRANPYPQPASRWEAPARDYPPTGYERAAPGSWSRDPTWQVCFL